MCLFPALVRNKTFILFEAFLWTAWHADVTLDVIPDVHEFLSPWGLKRCLLPRNRDYVVTYVRFITRRVCTRVPCRWRHCVRHCSGQRQTLPRYCSNKHTHPGHRTERPQ